ncbi:universal stress protein [Natrinema ejinorense]|uniref:Universal stress protein n=1 Tax=Natrinema ejinorense TaxID=373386 RepID=A0A2A5QUN3_9EURY|nr:universal stress protein [Natrinema ejinorense]PCR90514.1 universal stress protein [Natrinema ejinorense]
MYDSILVPIDGSDHAVRAAEHGLALARWFDATVHVLTVVDVAAAGGVFNAGGVDAEFVQRLEAEAETATERIEAIADGSETVRTALQRGSPADVILEYAAENGIDLIAMGTHGRTGVNRYVAGSVTEHVVRRSDVPVLTARVADRSEWTGGYDEVLLPTDGSEEASAAVDHGLGIATKADARVHAVNIVDVSNVAGTPNVAASRKLLSQFESQGERATEAIATRARDAGLEAVTAVQEGFPASGLLEYAAENEIDLIAMGTHGRTGLGRVLLGSTTERLIRRAGMPVLAVKSSSGDSNSE